MNTDRSRDIQLGLRLIPKLGEVMPEEADKKTNLIYENIEQRLRVPFVNFLFRVLANYPDYLALAWRDLEPHLLTRKFERAANELRQMALLDPPPGQETLDVVEPEAMERIRAFTDTIYYVLPKLLLVATTLDEGLASERSSSREPAEEAVAPGVAAGTSSLQMVSQDASDRVQKVYDEIRHWHDHPGVASYYRGIASYPEFLEAAWEQVKPVIATEPCEERKRALLDSARKFSGDLPLTGWDRARAAGCDDRHIEEITSMLAVFRFRVIPDTFVEVALIKALLDGNRVDDSSPFSFA